MRNFACSSWFIAGSPEELELPSTLVRSELTLDAGRVTMRKSLAAVGFFLLANAASAQSALDSVMVCPSVATTYEADKFQNCTMSRSTPTMNIALERNPEGLLLKLDSDDWKLERGKAYTVTLAAGSQTIDAKALAETKSITIALADRSFRRLRSANSLDIEGESDSMRVPLDRMPMHEPARAMLQEKCRRRFWL